MIIANYYKPCMILKVGYVLYISFYPHLYYDSDRIWGTVQKRYQQDHKQEISHTWQQLLQAKV